MTLARGQSIYRYCPLHKLCLIQGKFLQLRLINLALSLMNLVYSVEISSFIDFLQKNFFSKYFRVAYPSGARELALVFYEGFVFLQL